LLYFVFVIQREAKYPEKKVVNLNLRSLLILSISYYVWMVKLFDE